MASYELVFKQSVAKDLRALPKPDVKRIMAQLVSPRRGHAISSSVPLNEQVM